MNCPLCGRDDVHLYETTSFRNYWVCSMCCLVYVPRDQLISVEAEKQRYDQHENSDNNQYRTYFEKLISLFSPHLTVGMNGLDFGSGRSCLLADLLTLKGVPTAAFDLYYRNDPRLLQQKYSFVILSEVIEHLRDLSRELQQISEMVDPGGLLIVKTKPLPSRDRFAEWFYQRDPTHIQFFSDMAFRHISDEFGYGPPVDCGEDIYLFRKNP